MRLELLTLKECLNFSSNLNKSEVKHVYWMALVVKNSPAKVGDITYMVPSLDWEDPLEEVMPTHSSVLAWRISWTEEPGGL